MKNVLVIGAGKSSSTLIKYLIDNSKKENWKISIVDRDKKLILEKTNAHPSTEAFELDMMDEELRKPLIKGSDVVISMLPARFHIPIIKDCI